MNPRAAWAWAVAALASVLLLGSLTGHGTGLLGMGFMAHSIWSYVFIVATFALVLWLARAPEPDAPAMRGEPRAGRRPRT